MGRALPSRDRRRLAGGRQRKLRFGLLPQPPERCRELHCSGSSSGSRPRCRRWRNARTCSGCRSILLSSLTCSSRRRSVPDYLLAVERVEAMQALVEEMLGEQN
jgi:hypothetical protein